MQTRQEQLMVILAQSQGWLKGRDLAALLGVSDQTIPAPSRPITTRAIG